MHGKFDITVCFSFGKINISENSNNRRALIGKESTTLRNAGVNESLGIQSPSENGIMEPEDYLRIWLDAQANTNIRGVNLPHQYLCCNLQFFEQLGVILFSYQQLGSCLIEQQQKLPETDVSHHYPTLFQHLEVSSLVFFGRGWGHCYRVSCSPPQAIQVGPY